MDISLCVLTRDRPELFQRLVKSLLAFGRLSDDGLEVVVADNSREEASRQWYRTTADTYVEVSDEDLWYEGFAFAKGKAVRAASSDWVVIADLGEEWFEHGDGLIASIEANPSCPAFRTMCDLPRKVRAVQRGDVPWSSLVQDHGRVFNQRKMRLMGVIHEAATSRRKGIGWATYARKHDPVALISHAAEDSRSYNLRKLTLYDHLLNMVYEQPELRAGTDPYWFEDYWPKRLAEGWQDVSFEAWQKMEG